MGRNSSSFKWRHYAPGVIILCVRWCCRYQPSYRDLEDKQASYPEAFATSVKEKVLPVDCKLRRVKYLNHVIEQDHGAGRGGGVRCNGSARSTPPGER